MKKVRVLLAREFDPWLNLATEDWLYRDMDPSQDVLFLWRNSPTVVIGRYQNPWLECDLDAMEADGVKLARRQSGGGAVFHDLGNTNFTFMSSRASYSKERNNGIILAALARFGITAQASGRNDIVVDERKISGSAFKMSKDRAFHHGTLLINADLTRISNYLTPDKDKLKAKGIRSVRSRVANLNEFREELTHEQLAPVIIEEFFREYGVSCEIEELSLEMINTVPHLQSYYEKMIDWDWRYGKTPEFEYEAAHRFSWGKIQIHIDTKRGIMHQVDIFSDALVADLIDALIKNLTGIPFCKDDIVRSLNLLSTKKPQHKEKIEEVAEFLSTSLSFDG